MAYIQKEIKAGRVRYVKKYFTATYHPKGAKRSKPAEKTKAGQEKVNARNREITLWLRIEANFGWKDSHTVLHYFPTSRPSDLEAAEKDLNAALKECRKACKKAGVPFRWIAVTETKGQREDIFHHHVIVNREAQEFLWQSWETILEKQNRSGKCSSERLDRRDCHRKLASYLLKHSVRTMEMWKAMGHKRKQHWRASRNLEIPKETTRIISANQWAKEPRPRKGERLIKNDDGNTYEMGISDITGWPWMEYVALQEVSEKRRL